MAQEHSYRCELVWSGSTAEGTTGYQRAHQVHTAPADAPLRLSADPAFRGDPDLMNPEQLLLAAASSCQLLSFLSVAARAGLTVLDYRDAAEAVMPVTGGPMRIELMVLRPRITVAPGTDEDAVRRAVSEAHAACFIANTLNTAMTIEATVTAG